MHLHDERLHCLATFFQTDKVFSNCVCRKKLLFFHCPFFSFFLVLLRILPDSASLPTLKSVFAETTTTPVVTITCARAYRVILLSLRTFSRYDVIPSLYNVNHIRRRETHRYLTRHTVLKHSRLYSNYVSTFRSLYYSPWWRQL